MLQLSFLIIMLISGSAHSGEPSSKDQPQMYIDTLLDELVSEYQASRKKDANNSKSGKVPAQDVEYEQTTYRSTEEILRTLRPKAPGLYKEYDAHFRDGDRPQGNITTKIRIAPNGQVLEARIVGDAIKDAAFAIKVSAFFKSLKFEPIDSRAIDSVAIPFTFTPH